MLPTTLPALRHEKARLLARIQDGDTISRSILKIQLRKVLKRIDQMEANATTEGGPNDLPR